MMSTKKTQDVNYIIELIKEAKGFKKNSELANFIEVSRQVLNGWITRDSIGDYKKFTNKGFVEHFVRTGEGPMLIEETPEEHPVRAGWKNTTPEVDEHPPQSSEDSLPMVRHYRELAQMDADTFGEIQTWLNDMERLRPGYTGWFRLEFQNRFPEFDEWKGRFLKKANG